MWDRIQAWTKTPQGRDQLLTYLAEGGVLVGIVLVYRLAAHLLPEDGFDVYAVVRRTVTFLHLLVLMGMAVAVVRFVAMSTSAEERVGMLRTAFRTVTLAGGVFVTILWAFKGPVSLLFFGTTERMDLIPPIAMLIVGLVLHALIYSYWRGMQRMVRANVIQFIDLALVPNVAMWIGPGLIDVLWITAAMWCTIPLLGLFP
ncbi:MAG: oligosaccharide flippase family protein, partial [Flavobacteriales bacterium]|nr:oligosaccharide flippase family protein [Flavobacteriales bacterium]